MALDLTKKQTLILNFIDEFTKANNYSPSYREIMSGLGLTSVSAVAEHIDNLVAKGALRKVPGASRSLELVTPAHQETTTLFQQRLLSATPEEKRILLEAAKLLELEL